MPFLIYYINELEFCYTVYGSNLYFFLTFSRCTKTAHTSDSHISVDMFRSGANHALCSRAGIQVEEKE